MGCVAGNICTYVGEVLDNWMCAKVSCWVCRCRVMSYLVVQCNEFIPLRHHCVNNYNEEMC